MQGGVDISRIGIETLADDEAGFPVWLLADAEPANCGCQTKVSGHALPNIMKRGLRAPHVLAAASDEIGLTVRIIFGRTPMRRHSDIGLVFKLPQRYIVSSSPTLSSKQRGKYARNNYQTDLSHYSSPTLEGG